MPRFRRIVHREKGVRSVRDIPYTPAEEAAADAREVAFATDVERVKACRRTQAHLVSLVSEDFPNVTNLGGLDMLRLLNKALPGNSASQELRTAIACDDYCTAKMEEIQTYDHDTAVAYDPAADTGWPEVKT